MTKMSNCPFCGQNVIVEADEAVTDQELIELAADVCNCDGAKLEQNRKAAVQRAEVNIESLIVDENIQKVLKAAVEPISHGEITKITVKSGEETGSLTAKDGGKIKVDQSITRKQVRES